MKWISLKNFRIDRMNVVKLSLVLSIIIRFLGVKNVFQSLFYFGC